MRIINWLKKVIFSTNGDDWNAFDAKAEEIRDSAAQCWDETHANLADIETKMRDAREGNGCQH